MQVEGFDKFWDPKANRHMKGPKGRRVAGLAPHLFAWGTFAAAYFWFSYSRSDSKVYRAPPPPCEAPPPYREALALETTFEQPHLRRLEVSNSVPSHVPQKQFPLRDHAVYAKSDLQGSRANAVIDK